MFIKRVYEIDPLACPECGGVMKVVAFIEPPQGDVIEKILKHCGLWCPAAPRAAKWAAMAAHFPLAFLFHQYFQATLSGVVKIRFPIPSWPDWWIPGHKHDDPNPRPKAGIISGGLEMMLVMYHLTGDTKFIARVSRLG